MFGLHVAGHTDPAATGPAASVPGAIGPVSAEIAARWSERPHTLLLATGSVVDVLELPALATAAVEDARTLGVPVARLPTGRWLLFAATAEGGTDSWAPLNAERNGPLLHSQRSLVPVPPSRLPQGQVRWRSRPELNLDRLVPMVELVERVLPLLPAPIESADSRVREVRQDLAPAVWSRR